MSVCLLEGSSLSERQGWGVTEPRFLKMWPRAALVLLFTAFGLLSCGDSTGPDLAVEGLPVDGAILFLADREGGVDHLFVMGPDGTETLPRLPGEVLVRDAYWSHGGETIAYTVALWYGEAYYGEDIYLIEPDGSTGWPLVTSQGKDYQPRWSPDDLRIAFLSERQHPGPGVYVINADGTEERRLVDGRFPDDWGSWSPNGDRIVVSGDSSSPIRVIDVATGETTSLVEGCNPAFSPGGEWIAYSLEGIHVVKPDGSQQQRLTDYGESFRWDPQGQYISFRDRSPYTPYSLEMVGVDDKVQSVLVEYQESWKYIRHHSWSPDGKYVAYHVAMTLDNSESAVFLVEVETGSVQQLTHYPAPLRRPEWRPN